MAKVTKRDMFVEIADELENVGRPDLAEFVNDQITLIDKRKSAPRKPTSTQIENDVLKETIVEILSASFDGRTATQISVELGVTVQRTSALLRQLVEAKRVTRTEGKGKDKTRFSV